MTTDQLPSSLSPFPSPFNFHPISFNYLFKEKLLKTGQATSHKGYNEILDSIVCLRSRHVLLDHCPEQ